MYLKKRKNSAITHEERKIDAALKRKKMNSQ